jgi:predicted nucleotidyltransferase
LTEFVQRLETAVQPTCIILFGSVARGTDRIASDVDLIVISQQLPASLFDRLDMVNRLKRGLPVSIDVFPYTAAEFDRMLEELHVTALEAVRDGVALRGEGHLAELRAKYLILVQRGLSRTAEAWSFQPVNP